MREDNDHTIECCKDESKTHQCSKENCEDGKNNNNVCELFCDKENDRDTSAASPEKVDPVLYMDKNVMGWELTQIVKDICVDEGVVVQEKCSSISNQCGLEDLKKTDKTNVNPLDTKLLEDGQNINKRPQEQAPCQLQDNEKRSLEITAHQTEELNKAEEKISSVSKTTSQEPNKTCNKDDKFSSNRFGETSRSDSISGHITYSGPITYSGSLSVRSDASTMSERSFTFPILQSEWNSSPVKMAKADKRRQKRGWRHAFLCCRFS